MLLPKDLKLEKVLDQLPVGVMVVADGVVTYCNEPVRKLLTMTSFHVIGRNVTELLDPTLLERIMPGAKVNITVKGKRLLVWKDQIMLSGDEVDLYLLTLEGETDEFLHVNYHQVELLEAMMEFAFDGLVMVDREGYITALSTDYASFLGVNQEEAIGKHVTEVIENTRMHIVAKSGKTEVAELQKIRGDYMIATRVPIIKNGQVTGAVGKVLFKNVGGFNSLYKRVNSMEKELKRYKGEMKELNKAAYQFSNIIGSSPLLVQAKKEAKKAAKSDSNVLLLGESGTGKELFAHSIHNESRRAFGSFVKVNCAAIPADLLESELFGYEEGSFTGAIKGGKKGKFEAADGGTIFLDEIGELPLHMQVKFLRVLQEKEVEKIGSSTGKSVDVRVIAATNRDLEKMVQAGEFRLDLYYRLNVMPITVPSLRDRKGDIPRLARYFLEKYRERMNMVARDIHPEAILALEQYEWPGNIRELENVIERAVNVAENEKMIRRCHLPEKITGVQFRSGVRPLEQVMEETEKEAILNALRVTNNNRTKAANLLQISRTSLYEKMKKHRLS
ncbi:sigma-54 interaction domain-containing protein [Halalkalibacterium halodurans]|uniref:AAA family ATPase n=1 Tax=Halalkalibacterium halodurans TaxID=86665 RepID=A0A0M0KF65_ALKHA|nr:sigma-54-dependent Fis family transcriptional regulator [Halalkalibacterium halodurans]TPE67157.1 sigma-54-dependent transcriptional regulator [Halalkalibacterium halodurans]